MIYYNFIQLVEELYEIMEQTEKKLHPTIRLMLDETVYHFLDMHRIPYEKQGEFLTVMFPNCPKAVQDYKLKKFDMGH